MKKIKEYWNRIPTYGKWILVIGWGFIITMLIFGKQIYEALGWR